MVVTFLVASDQICVSNLLQMDKWYHIKTFLKNLKRLGKSATKLLWVSEEETDRKRKAERNTKRESGGEKCREKEIWREKTKENGRKRNKVKSRRGKRD